MKEKINNIKKLLDINGGRSAYEHTVAQTIEAIHHIVPNFNGVLLPEEMDEIINDIYQTVIPIYDRNFTNEQIIELIQFFETDIGKIYLSKMGIVAMESMQVGKKHGEIIYNILNKKSNN